jgi:hypothetical protein
MATTTNYGWTTPDDTALVKDGAAAIRTLGTSVDTTTKNLNPSTTLGDVEYRSSTSNTNTRLGIGSSGQCLTVNSGVPSWQPSTTSVLTTTGDLPYASAANTLARVGIGSTGQVLTVASGVPSWATLPSAAPASASATVATEESTSSTTYTDLSTSGPAVTITTGTKALVIVTAQIYLNINERLAYMSYAVSGASSIAASDAVAVQSNSQVENRMSAASRLTTLTAGSNTFTAKYKSTTTTGYFKNRNIIVIDLGS